MKKIQKEAFNKFFMLLLLRKKTFHHHHSRLCDLKESKQNM